MTQFLDIFGFLSVLLRGCMLVFQSVAVGGVVFSLLLTGLEGTREIARSCRRLTVWSAVLLALTQASYVASDAAILMGTADLSLGEIAGANFFISGSAAVILALVLAALAGRGSPAMTLASLVVSAGILAASVGTSHAAARVDYRLTLSLLTGLHHAATASWIGGLPSLLIAITSRSDPSTLWTVAGRFSRMAQVSVGILLTAGLALAWFYMDSPAALLTTGYGAMIGAKIALFALLMMLGALNYFMVRRVRAGGPGLVGSLRRFAEAEIGIGITVILAAGSLTSQPPAVDLVSDRMEVAEIVERMTPRWPRLKPPPSNELYSPALLDPEVRERSGLESYVPGQLSWPVTEGEIMLSEFNHNWSGLVVLTAGVLALLARFGWPWAKGWPLAFLALAVFLFFLADADYWPIGPLNFWTGFTVPEVLQHRLVVPLIVAFAFYEWRVQTGRARSPHAALVFPLVCAAGGALLLTHTHSLNNAREELLAELSHIPIALFGVTAGWARWLELRLTSGYGRVLSWVWPVCFILVGAVLLAYRES